MKKICLATGLLFLFISCSSDTPVVLKSREGFSEVLEVKIQEINLEGEMSEREAEISGLAWYGDYLILLPQFPFQYGDGVSGSLFYLEKQRILDYLEGDSSKPLTPSKIKLYADGLEYFNRPGSGYEALAFNKDTVYAALESYDDEDTEGYIVMGEINFSENKIVLNQETLSKIESKNLLPNLAEEAITFFEGKVYALHETNGVNVNESPTVSVFSSDLKKQNLEAFPNVEYRITDATDVSQDSTFWVINYLWKGDVEQLKPSSDTYFEDFGIGTTHKKALAVERLLKLKITGTGIILADSEPVYIELDLSKGSRNWEGIVKLDNLGFIVATDMFPVTILAFIPFEAK